MKVYAVVGAVMSDLPFPVTTFLGLLPTREEAMTVLKTEWERIEHLIEEGEPVDEETRARVDAEWASLEFPIIMAGEDSYEIIETEVPDAASS